MARARNIKPSFFKNEDLVNLSFETRLLFIGLWTLADREGRLEDRPKKIKMEIFPGDSVDIERALTELHASRFILRYSSGEFKYIQILNFCKHQNPHHKEGPSTIPKPEASPSQTPDKPESSSVSSVGVSGVYPADPGFLIPDSLQKASSAGADRFPEFWKIWPKSQRKQARGKCELLWKRKGLNSKAEAIIAHIKLLAATKAWREGFDPAPLTYLNQERWDGADMDAHEPGGKPWFIDGWAAISMRGAELGLFEDAFEQPQDFKTAVLRAAGITAEMVKKAEAMAK